MKKYILIGLMLSTGQFFAGTSMVERWKKLDEIGARILWKNLNIDRRIALVANLIDDASEKLQQCFKDNNFLFFIQGSNLYLPLIPHNQIIPVGYLNELNIQTKLGAFFQNVHSGKDINDMQIIVNNLNTYYSLIKNYAQSEGKTLKEMAKNQDIIELLILLLQGQYVLPGKFAKADSKEQKLLKKVLLDKEDTLEAVESELVVQ